MYSETTATKKIRRLTKRIRVIQGGTSASKTISTLLFLIAKAQTDKVPTLTSIVSETFPHLKRGAIRDFTDILASHGYWQDEAWNKTDSIYTFPNNSRIEFFSADQPDKVRGPRRDRLFINEANNVPYEVFDQLEVRTKEFVIIDYNPTNEFWWFTEVKPVRNDWEHIILTYRDNEALSPEIVASIEQRKARAGWWKVYGEGQLGQLEGKIYANWNLTLEEVPHEARLVRRGLDFGFTNDPTAGVDIYEYNGGYILDEFLFQKGMSNKAIADTILNQEKQVMVVADSAEPKSIDDIKQYGINIQGVEKGRDSVRNGINMVQEQQISVTKRSTNIIAGYRNYMWATDRMGKIISPNEPDHAYSDMMDAIRYGFSSIKKAHAPTIQELIDLDCVRSERKNVQNDVGLMV